MERIILDVDTGQDDALAIAFASALTDKIKIEGLIASYGNVDLPHTLENTLNIAESLELECPVYRGSEKPLARNRVNASHFHGLTGLDGPVFPERIKKESAGDGIEWALDTVLSNPGEITYVSVGPMTDLAVCSERSPEFLKSLKRIVMMGGSLTGGNATAHAEFNVYADPEAANKIFSSGTEIYMFGLDGTSDIRLVPEIYERLLSYGDAEYRDLFIAQMEQYIRTNREHLNVYPAMYDPSAIAFFADKNIFEYEVHSISVDVSGGEKYGKTTPAEGQGNVFVAVRANIPEFWRNYEEAYRKIHCIYKNFRR